MNCSKHSGEHDPSRWIDQIRLYYPLDYNPVSYFYINRQYWLITYWTDGRKFNSILEVGIGSSLAPLCAKLMHPWKRVVGCDISPEIIEYARQRYNRFGADIELFVADARSLPFGNKEFDSLLSEGMLEHWPEPSRIQMLHEMRRVANRLVIDLPVNYRHRIPVGGYGDEFISGGPEYWRGLFERCGLKIREEFVRERRRDGAPVRAGWVLE